MAAVRQQVLNWLYSVLTSEYTDVNRTYNDVAQTLSHYSSVSSRTDVYTHEDGSSALLLVLSGTLPVNFRGTTYRFPIAIWVPHGYPHEAPMVYVTPTEGMMVRPGQHVDPQGKVYHPYLVGWAEFWDKSNILDFLAILRDIFAKEPPVVARQQQNAPRSQPVPTPTPAPPPIPPLPPGMARPQSEALNQNEQSQQQPPPPPPKPTAMPPSSVASPPSSRESGPPLPPLPTQQAQHAGRYSIQPQPQPRGYSHAPQRSSSLRYEGVPPLPQPPRQTGRTEPSDSPVSPVTPPEAPQRHAQYSQSYQRPQQTHYTSHPHPQASLTHTRPPVPPSYAHQEPPYSGTQVQFQQFPQGPQSQSQSQPRPKPPPPPDLIDAPLILATPSEASTNLPAPPIPPNPEKDMLLHNIGRALYSQRQHTRQQTASSLPGLESQHKAMLKALSNMQAEVQALESLSELLQSNATISHKALHDADAVIESSQHRIAPNVDELLVAPTVVGNQLYELVSEERALGDALFVLGRTVERGRITSATFVKMTRSLAREWYLKKALAKKIARGMGLATY